MINPKKIIKRILSGILAVTLCSGYAFAEKIETENAKTGFETELLTALGIMDSDNPEKELTRVDFIQMLSKMTFFGEDYTNIATKKKPFIDVENYHYASSNIERFAQIGVISGDGNGYAKINDKITFDEACALMLNAAGYYRVAESYGEYPYNYRKLATEVKLTKNVSVTENVTKESAARLLVNLMNVEVVQVSFSDKLLIERGNLFMEEKMNLKLAEGILQGADDVALVKTSVSDGTVLIDGIAMDNAFGEKAKDYIGYKVNYYYTKDGENFLFAYPEKNTVLTIKSEDIISYENLKYSYADENYKAKTAKLDTGAVLVINDVLSENYLDFVPAYGDVKLIDNDGDDDYDAVFIDSYEIVWISNVMNSDMSLAFENKLSDGSSLIKLEEYDECQIFDENGMECEFEKLSANQLVSVKRYQKEKIKIYICREMKSGRFERISDMDSYYEVTIDGEIYKMAKNAYHKNWDKKTGAMITVYFDARGQIGAVIASVDDVWVYGYIISGRGYISDDTGLTAVKVKLLSESGAIETYTVDSEKIRVDGVQTALSAVAADFELNRLIRYKTKNSEIIAVDFPKDFAVTNTDEMPFTNSNDVMLRRASGTYIYRYDSQVFKRNSVSNELDGEIVLRNTDVPVFYIPAKDKIATALDKQFYTGKASGIKRDKRYVVEGYGIDADSLMCDAVVIFLDESSTIQNDEKVPMVIGGIETVLNENEEQVYKISGYISGTEYEYISSDEITKDLSKILSVGDIVKFAFNSNNQITDYKIIYSQSGGGVIDKHNSNTGKYDHGHIERYAFGYANRVKDGVMQFNNMDDGFSEYFKLAKFTTILIVDTSKKRNPIIVGNANDILSKEIYGDKCDEIVILTNYGDRQPCMWIMRK